MRNTSRSLRLVLALALFALGGLLALHRSPLGPLYKHALEKKVSASPDGQLQLVAYKLPLLGAMPGGGGDAMALVELQRWPGVRLDRADPPDDEILFRDVEVRWEPDRVWFGVARLIELP